jgi:hypothetical protein
LKSTIDGFVQTLARTMQAIFTALRFVEPIDRPWLSRYVLALDSLLAFAFGARLADRSALTPFDLFAMADLAEPRFASRASASRADLHRSDHDFLTSEDASTCRRVIFSILMASARLGVVL